MKEEHSQMFQEADRETQKLREQTQNLSIQLRQAQSSLNQCLDPYRLVILLKFLSKKTKKKKNKNKKKNEKIN